MEIQAGTSGYSYKGWVGAFYPEKTKPADMLAYYAKQLPTVEINNTFYRLPKESVLQAWAASVPDSFRFTIKASRRITHLKRLKGVEDETGYLLRVTSALGEKLGALLFQLPPNLKCDLERLDAFLGLLPEGTPAALEFRHESWLDEPVLERLRSRNVPLVHVDDEDGAADELVPTADWGYLRLRRPDYDETALRAWNDRISKLPWERALLYFKHEDDGAGPKMAARFLEVSGAPTKRAPAAATPAEKPAEKKRPARKKKAG